MNINSKTDPEFSEKNMLTEFANGNQALRSGDYVTSIEKYIRALIQTPELKDLISENLSLAKKRYRKALSQSSQKRVAVCGWELAHNPAGRVYTLAKIYETFADVEIIGSIFPKWGREIWEPIRDTPIKKHSFVVDDESNFLQQAIELVIANPYDIVHLSKPRAPNIIFGILYKFIWDAMVLMDIDDEELAFVGEENPISIDDYIQQYDKLPDLRDLSGKDWTRIAVGLAKEFDDVTVCNSVLQAKYGGEIIRHARDERIYQPSAERKRRNREKIGIPLDSKVVLFHGTPRRHKGLIETAQAISSLKDKNIVFVIIGSFPPSELSLKEKLLEVRGVRYYFFENQPIEEAPNIVSIADCCVILSDHSSQAANYQTPAKISDALCMDVVVLLQESIGLTDIKLLPVTVKIPTGCLRATIKNFFDDPEKYKKFLNVENFSISKVSNDLKLFTEQQKSNTKISEFIFYELLRLKILSKRSNRPQENFINLLDLDQYEGRLESSNSILIFGWCINKLNSNDVFNLDIYINNIFYCKLKNNIIRKDLIKSNKTNGVGGFHLELPNGFLEKGCHTVDIYLPNKTLFKSFKIESKSDLFLREISHIPPNSSVSVIVPIFNAPSDVRLCIDRLIKYTSPNIDIILINDFSSDPEIERLLFGITQKNIRIFHNEVNLGYTKTINRGLKLAQSNDVILLNSDARVTPRWVEGLRLALSSGSNVATVTPMSDRAGAFSAPLIGNENVLPWGVAEEEYAISFRRNSIGYYPKVPTGNGFCMYIRRKCIDEIGVFDEVAFPIGYGEENDFCMRARSRGWENIVDDRTYIYHSRSSSFGEKKVGLIKEGRKIVNARYPDYTRAISVFSEGQLFLAARYRARLSLNKCIPYDGNKPRILFVISTLTGGTPQTNRDLMHALKDNWEPWLLHSNSKIISLYKVGSHANDELIRQYKLLEPIEPSTHTSSEYDRIVFSWLSLFDFEIVHIRHLAWHSLNIVEIAKRAGQKVILSFHDYYSICPSVKLLDEKNIFCGGICSNTHGKCGNPLWGIDSLPDLKNSWVYRWRENFSNAVKNADFFVTTSTSARNLLLKNHNTIDPNRFKVIKHGRDFDYDFLKISNSMKLEGKIRVLIAGNIDTAKGMEVIVNLIAKDIRGDFEFHFIGPIPKLSGQEIYENIFYHGAYKRSEFRDLVEKIKPNIGGVLSIWDETWCHTLTEMWSVGLPVMTLDFPNLKSRVEDAGAGWVFTLDFIQNSTSKLANIIRSSYLEKLNGVKNWQSSEGIFRTARWMSSQYHALYVNNLSTLSGNTGNVEPYIFNSIYPLVCPSSNKLDKAPGSTYVRVWEVYTNDPLSPRTYCKLSAKELVAGIRIGEIHRALIQRNVLDRNSFNEILSYKDRFKYDFDIDDNLFSVPQSIDVDGQYELNRPLLKQVAIAADSITVSTASLRTLMLEYNENVKVVENKLSRRLWRKIRPLHGFRSNRILYFGTKSHKKDLELIFPFLDELHKKVQFKLVIVGAIEKRLSSLFPWLEIIDVPNQSKNYPEFVSFLKLVASDCKVAVAPLVGDDFDFYKSDLKLHEYGALDLPVIASKKNPYTNCKLTNIHFVENNADDWIGSLLSIIGN